MPDKPHMLRKSCVGEFIRHTEDFAQCSDAVRFKHLNVHTFGDAVFNLIPADIKIIVGNAAVPYSLVVIRYIPFPRNVKAVRKKVDDG